MLNECEVETISAPEEKLLTFGQLLKLKREQMKLSQMEVIRRTKITGLSSYEADISQAGKKILTKLIGFYKITEEEIKNCREAPRRKLSVSTSLGFNHSHGKRITVLLESLAHVIRDVTAMQSHGLLATRLRLDCLDNLDKAQLLLQDAVIIERLI